jgi:hypothetical protein
MLRVITLPLHSARVARNVVIGLLGPVMFVSGQGVSGAEEQPFNM